MRRLIIIAVAVLISGSALASYAYRDGNGAIQYFFDFVCQGVQCSAQVLIDSSGNEKATSANPLIIGSQVNITPVDCSGTISSGATAQNAISASATLHGFTIANIDSTAGSGEPLWLSFTTTAAASTVASYPLAPPGPTSFIGFGSYTTPLGFGSNKAVSVVAATTGHKFSCTYW